MADAPASGGGWGALEIILAIVLGIGLIATLTGTPLSSITGSSTAKKTTTATVKSNSYAFAGCTAVITNPLKNQQIDNTVIIEGKISSCLSSTGVPDTLNAQVADSTGAFISQLMPVDVNKNLFGDTHFSAVIPLEGVAHSTSATVTISGVRPDGTLVSIRIPIKLTPSGTTTPVTATTTTSTVIETNVPTYTSPAQTTTTTTNTGATTTTGSGSSTTF